MRRFWRGLGRRAAALLVRLGLLQPGKIMYIGGSGTLPTPLTREEEAQVIARLEQGDEEARQTLIERNPSSSATCAWWCTSPGGLRTRGSTWRT